jgi:GTPase SAR1 family protein
MQDIKQNVQVAVRIRSLPIDNIKDSRNRIGVCITPENKNKLNEYVSVAISDPDSRRETKYFAYDRVLSMNDNQEGVYQVVRPIIAKCLEGYNGCIFAYGQTSTGKTYTMEGMDGELRGVIPRVAEQIMAHVAELNANDGIEFSIHGSYLEIYQEQLRDLLNDRNHAFELRIRMDPMSTSGKELYIEGLTERLLKTAHDFTKLIQLGRSRRTVAATNMNLVSSRSHAVFTLTIDQTIRRNTINEEITSPPSKRSKIHLIDLAGSERVDSTGAIGDRMKEGAAINVSLSAIGNVINALSTKAAHIPYRDSKLTYLLSDSLGGNSLTLVLACISPLSSCYEESIGTLRFAERAKKVQNRARVNIDPATIRYTYF